MAEAYKRIGHFKDVESFRAYMAGQGLSLPCDDRILSAKEISPLAQPMMVRDFKVGNRWCIHPMEGWDGEPDGRPSAHTLRRWRHFGLSGAKLIWGGEAFAVQHGGRANPNQLYFRPENMDPMRHLLRTLREAHEERFGKGAGDDLLVGLQLTHSGRFCKPTRQDRFESRIAYHHPLLDRRVGIDPKDDSAVLSDAEIKTLIETFIYVAGKAERLGFQFVDIKACHGYLGHEFLSAYDRPGPYGGSFENRTRFLREIIEGIRAMHPNLRIGVRLSVFDMPAFRPDPMQTGGGKFGPGIPDDFDPSQLYPAFGCRRDIPLEIDLTEPVRLLTMMRDELKVDMVNLSAGSPYYNPHIQRPAFFPPSDGYTPPEDPLVGCVRQIEVVRDLKQRVPGLPMVGTAYSYLQEWLPHVAQAVVREGWVDSVGLGRVVLSYPDLPADCLEHGELRRPKLLCRTFSDCTTAPRSGIVSGCYPLDDYYKDSPMAARLKEAKAKLREKLKT
ncbi:MAG: hypothetical protein WD768_21665 [Phycisphaeraceae bacterium]